MVSFFSGFIQHLVQHVWENMKDPDYAWGVRRKKKRTIIQLKDSAFMPEEQAVRGEQMGSGRRAVSELIELRTLIYMIH